MEHHIAQLQPGRGGADRVGETERVSGIHRVVGIVVGEPDSERVQVRHDSDPAELIVPCEDYAEHGRAVKGHAQVVNQWRRRRHDAEVLMVDQPAAVHVHELRCRMDRRRAIGTSEGGPGRLGVHAKGISVEVELVLRQRIIGPVDDARRRAGTNDVDALEDLPRQLAPECAFEFREAGQRQQLVGVDAQVLLEPSGLEVLVAFHRDLRLPGECLERRRPEQGGHDEPAKPGFQFPPAILGEKRFALCWVGRQVHVVLQLDDEIRPTDAPGGRANRPEPRARFREPGEPRRLFAAERPELRQQRHDFLGAQSLRTSLIRGQPPGDAA